MEAASTGLSRNLTHPPTWQAILSWLTPATFQARCLKRVQVVSLFSQKKDDPVRNFLLKLINNNCPGLAAFREGPRATSRINLTVVVTIIPISDGKMQVHDTFTAVTKNFSNDGVAIVLDHRQEFDWVVLGFRLEGHMAFFLAEANHIEPMGGGFYQIGFHLAEVVLPAEYPELSTLPA